MGWIAQNGVCVACMCAGIVNRQVEVAHLRAPSLEHGKRYTGKAERPSDCWTLPLCAPHHRGDKRKVKFAQHEGGEMDFWRRLGIDPFALCIDLYDAYREGRLAYPIIARYAGAARRSTHGL